MEQEWPLLALFSAPLAALAPRDLSSPNTCGSPLDQSPSWYHGDYPSPEDPRNQRSGRAIWVLHSLSAGLLLPCCLVSPSKPSEGRPLPSSSALQTVSCGLPASCGAVPSDVATPRSSSSTSRPIGQKDRSSPRQTLPESRTDPYRPGGAQECSRQKERPLRGLLWREFPRGSMSSGRALELEPLVAATSRWVGGGSGQCELPRRWKLR